MSFELPGWVQPILTLYGIPWPDVDEDAFHWLQQPLRDFGRDLVAVSEAIESAINDLHASNPSETLLAIGRYCAEIRKEFLDPIQNVCDGLAGQPCDLAYEAVIGVKWALVGLLTTEIVADIADVVETAVTFGADVALTGAEALALRTAVGEAIQAAEAEVASQLQSVANAQLDNFANSLINPFINSVERTVESRLDSYLPRLVLGEVGAAKEFGTSVAQKLYLNREQLDHAVSNIWNSAQHLQQAASKLDGIIDEIFSKPDPMAPPIPTLSSSMRIALMSVVKCIKSDLVSGIESLIHHVEKHFVALLADFVKALDELDSDTRRAAAAERAAAPPNVAVLSVGSTWIATSGGVGRMSGRVDVAEADRVQVTTAEGVGFTAGVNAQQMAVSSQQAKVDTSLGMKDTGVESLDVKAEPPGPLVTEAHKGVGPVEQLKVGVEQSAPQVETAQAPGSTVPGVGSHHGGQHAPQVGVPETRSAETGVEHLNAKRSHRSPTTATEDASARTEEVGTLSAGPDSGSGKGQGS